MTEEINAEQVRKILREEIQRSNEIESKDLFVTGLKVLILASLSMIIGICLIELLG